MPPLKWKSKSIYFSYWYGLALLLIITPIIALAQYNPEPSDSHYPSPTPIILITGLFGLMGSLTTLASFLGIRAGKLKQSDQLDALGSY